MSLSTSIPPRGQKSPRGNILGLEWQAAVAARYRAGESINTVAAAYQVSKKKVRSALKRQGVPIRTTSEAMRGKVAHNRTAFTTEQTDLIRRWWQNEGVAANVIAERLGLRSATPIYRLIEKNHWTKGTPKRRRDALLKTLGESRFDEVRRRFNAGDNFAELALFFQVPKTDLKRLLSKRGLKDHGATLSQDTRREIMRIVQTTNRVIIAAIAEKYRVPHSTLLTFLNARGVDLARRVLGSSDTQHAIDLFSQGLDSEETAAALSLSASRFISTHRVSAALRASGQRRGTSTLPIEHISPVVGNIKVKGGWEKDLARYLDKLTRDGVVETWAYEAIVIPYHDGKKDRKYHPDFIVRFADGKVELWESKGRHFPKTAEKNSAAVAAGYVVRTWREREMRDLWAAIVPPWDWNWLREQGEK